MTVAELLKSLALGELSNLALGDTGEITVGKVPKLIQYTNEGLLKLYTRFLLSEKDLILEMRTGTTYYHLLKKFAYSQYDAAHPPAEWDMPYIMDLGREPFLEDVVKVLEVYDPWGQKLPLNDLEDPRSVFTPTPTQIQIPHAWEDRTISVVYQARHVPLPTTDYADVAINLPECLHSALRAFIAHKTFMHMNTQESTAKGQEHAMMFEGLCQEAIDMDLVNTSSSTTNTRFEKRGFK